MTMMCLSQAMLNFNVSVPLELINMAGTYYQTLPFSQVEKNGKVVEKTKKVYLMEGIKGHKLFTDF